MHKNQSQQPVSTAFDRAAMAATSNTLLNRNTTVVHLPVKIPASNAPDFTDVFAAKNDRLKSSAAHPNAVVASHQILRRTATAASTDVDKHSTIVMAKVTTTESVIEAMSSAPSVENNIEIPDTFTPQSAKFGEGVVGDMAFASPIIDAVRSPNDALHQSLHTLGPPPPPPQLDCSSYYCKVNKYSRRDSVVGAFSAPESLRRGGRASS